MPAVVAEEDEPRDADRARRARSGARTIQITPSTAIVDEPDHHDRAEQPADAVRAVLLDHEDADQDRDRERHDVRARTAASRPRALRWRRAR